MRIINILGIVCIAAISIAPSFAMEAGMMASGEVMATMPDGHMGSMMMTDDAMATKMGGMSTPATGCMMMMTDKAGMVSMVDTSSAEAKAECEKIAMMPPATAAEGAMAEPGMMPASTVMAMMPDGHMGSMMMTDDAMATKMMGMSTPATGCVMMMSGKDGMMSMVDTSSAEAKAECEKIAMTAPAM